MPDGFAFVWNDRLVATSDVVELSHPIRDGMVTYPGLPAPEISDHLSRAESRSRYAAGTEFQIGRICMVGNTGTYLDTPFHRFAGGADLAAVRLASVADLPGIVVRVPDTDRRAVGPDLLAGEKVAGRAVLFHTGWDRHWGTPRYGEDHPFLAAETADLLVDHGAVLVGIDSVNVDDIEDLTRPVHTTLLAAGILVLEHMRGLRQLPGSDFRLHAAPPMFEGVGTFPVRAYAMVPARYRGA